MRILDIGFFIFFFLHSNLQIFVFQFQVKPQNIERFKNIKDMVNNTESSILELNFVILHQHFIRGKLKVRFISF